MVRQELHLLRCLSPTGPLILFEQSRHITPNFFRIYFSWYVIKTSQCGKKFLNSFKIVKTTTEDVDMGVNSFDFQMFPTDFGRIKSLRKLDVSGNTFTGL